MAMIQTDKNKALADWKRIESVMETKHITKAELARRLGLNSANVSNWSRRGIPADKIQPVADVLEASVDQLLGRVSEIPQGGIPVVLSGNIPVIGGAKLGDDGFFVEMYPCGGGDGHISLPSKDPHAYALRCEGSSMMPRIQHGEYVVAEPSHEAEPGDEVVVQALDGRVMVKRFLYKRDGCFYLGSVNQAMSNIVINESEVRAVHPVLAIIPSKFWNPN